MRTVIAALWNWRTRISLCLLLWPAPVQSDSPAWTRHLDAGYEALQKNHLAESEKEYQVALQEAEKFGPRDLRLSETLEALATVYYAENKGALAKPLCARAYDIETRLLGPERWPNHDLYHRAQICWIQGRYAEAEAIDRRQLTFRQKAFGMISRETASALSGLAYVYYRAGKYHDAEPLYREATSILEKLLGPHHLLVGQTLDGLARVYLAEGRYAEAEPLFRRAVTIRQQWEGDRFPWLSYTLEYLAIARYHQRGYAEAARLENRALAIRDASFGLDSPRTVNSMVWAGDFERARGHYPAAETMYSRALPLQEKRWGISDPHVAPTLRALAICYEGERRYSQAEPFFRRAVAIDEKRLKPQDPQLANDLQRLAVVCYSEHRLPEAEELVQRALAIREKALGPWKPATVTSLLWLGTITAQERKYSQAEAVFRRVLEARRSGAVGDLAATTALAGLGGVDFLQGKRAAAEQLWQQVLTRNEKKLGPDSPGLITPYRVLAGMHMSERKYGLAAREYGQALAIATKRFGSRNPTTLQLQHLLALSRQRASAMRGAK